MKVGTVVRWKQYLPGNLAALVGDDLATVIGRMKGVCTEDGVVTDYNEATGRINVLFPEYGCEQIGLHVDCFVEEGQVDLSQPPAVVESDMAVAASDTVATPVVEKKSWWQRLWGAA